jgi:hypothetical protein
MDDSTHHPAIDRVVALLEQNARDDALARLEAVQSTEPDDRKAALRSLRTVAEETPSVAGPLCPALAAFLRDDERAVRLTTAKLFVTLAEATPDAVRPAVPSLADALADDEFYYVRARSAEALGYVALDYPDAVADPDIVADLHIGLSVEEPEVKEKLAKALAYLAVGDPDRLRHQVPSLADHLDDPSELVRYHLCTALVAVGCEHPGRLSEPVEAVRARLTDGSAYVRGRAAEALAVLAASGADVGPIPDASELETDEEECPSFLTERVRALRRVRRGGTLSGEGSDGVGTIDSVRPDTDEVVEAITSSDGDDECPHCGLGLAPEGPPTCPRCGSPY